MATRLYHPDLDSFADVPDAEADSWAGAGWRKTPKKGLHSVEEYPEVDSFPGHATIPVLEDTSPTITGTGATVSASAGTAAAAGSGSSSARTGSASTTVNT